MPVSPERVAHRYLAASEDLVQAVKRIASDFQKVEASSESAADETFRTWAGASAMALGGAAQMVERYGDRMMPRLVRALTREGDWISVWEARSLHGGDKQKILASINRAAAILGDSTFPRRLKAAYGLAVKENQSRTASGGIDGMSRREVAKLVNAVIERAPTKGVHRDQYWKPIQAIWRGLENAGIPFGITGSEYQHEVIEGQRVPVRKVWNFEVNFTNERGRPTTVYGRVVAAGAGSVEEPLEVYDVTAYAS